MPIATIGTNRRSSITTMSIQDMVRETYLISSNPGKSSRRHMDVKVAEVVRFVLSEEAPRSMSLALPGAGSFLLLGFILRGLSFIYSKHLESLVKDFEHCLFHSRGPRVSSPSRIPTANRRSTSSAISRRRHSLATTFAGLSPIRIGDCPVDDNSSVLFDLDALCVELSRREDVIPPAVVAKRVRSSPSSDDADASRISSRTSEVDLLALDQFPDLPFDATLPAEFVLPVEPALPDMRPARSPIVLKGFDPRPTLTNLQWARATQQRCSVAKHPRDFAIQQTVLVEKQKLPSSLKKRRCDAVSVVSAVDGENIADELRADNSVDFYDDDEIIPIRRESVASSFAPSRASFGNNNIASAMKKFGVKETTMLGFQDVCHHGSSAAAVFAQLLVAAANDEIKFVHSDLGFDNSKTRFVLVSDDESSDSD